MNLSQLQINRIVIHQLHDHDIEGTRPEPTYGDRLTVLGPKEIHELVRRILAVTSSGTKSAEMDIARFGVGSVLDHSDGLARCDDNEFIFKSRPVADQLHSSLYTRKIPGGILVVFSGTCDTHAAHVVGYIKANIGSAFQRQANDLVLIEDLFLSESADLYKVGIFKEDVNAGPNSSLQDRWKALVYDRDYDYAVGAGSKYFYDRFLGLKPAASDARFVRDFLVLSDKFFESRTGINLATQVDLQAGLHTYLTMHASEGIQVHEFSENFVPDEYRDDYNEYMASKNFPDRLIRKDLSQVEASLDQRKFATADKKILLRVPASALSNKIVDFDVRDAPDGSGEKWTTITIKSALRGLNESK